MRLRVMLIVALILFFASSSLFGQDITDMVMKIDKLEKQVQKIEATYQQELKKLRNQLKEISPANTAEMEGMISTLVAQIAQLDAEMVNLQSQLSAAEEENQVVYASLNSQIEQAMPTINSSAPAVMPSVGGSDLQLSGFVDASYLYDTPSGGSSFGFDQTEVDIQKAFGSIGSLRADVEWVNDGMGGFSLDVEQGYVVFSPEFMGPLNLTFGKFNAPIGFEGVDAPDLYQYSWSLVYNYGIPGNLTGAMVSADLGQGFNLATYLCNGWDQNVDVNTGKTLGWHLGYANEAWGGIGFSFLRGAESAAEGDFTTVMDWDVTVMPLAAWTLGGELNFGRTDFAAEHSNWWGLLVMSHYDFNDWVGFTIRYDYFDDQDGIRLDPGIEEKRQAITLAPTFVLGAGMGALIEFRTDFSDQEVFENKNGDYKKTASTLVYEMTFTF